MNYDNFTSTSKISREQLIQTLNKDLASEYQAIIAFIVYSQVLKRAAYADIAAELELHAAEDFQQAKKTAKQIDYLGGIPCVRLDTVETPDEPVAMLFSSIVENIEHEIEWASLLDIGVAHTDFPVAESPSKPRPTRVSPTKPGSGFPNQKNGRSKIAKRGARNASASTMPQPA